MFWRMFTPLILLALVASACGGSDSDSEGPASAVDPDAPPMASSSPIGAFFEAGGGYDAAITEYSIKVEEQLVVCMAQQGFEYKQSVPAVLEIDRLQSELTWFEWASQYGYGISTAFESVLQMQTGDPNTEIIFSLPEHERDLWVEALVGPEGFANSDADDQPLLEEQGCVGQALLATGGGDVIEGMDDFDDAYEDAEAALFDRPEMISAVTAWSRCMGEAGYSGMVERGDTEASIQRRFERIVAPLERALDRMDPDDGRALIEGDAVELEELPGLDVDALRELQKDEVELALVDLGCYSEHVKTIYEPLRDDLESGLLTEYRGELEALRTIGS